MDVKFAFEKGGKNIFGEIYRPIAKVSFKSPQKNLWTDTWMVIDTGADFTILPRYLAKDLGISLENDCSIDSTFGVGGEQTLYLLSNKITIRMGNIEKQGPIAFLDNNDVPALMGRLGFIETFDTTFLKKPSVIFKD